ncbi:MAG: protein translocase subunit SecD [Clostridia bacterium]|nr:protein translocase subunit SecD [Clostridia bacterium]
MRTKSIATFVAFILIIIVLASVAAFGTPQIGTFKLPNVFGSDGDNSYGIVQGIDLKGGARLVYQVVDENGNEIEPSTKEMNDAVDIMYSRLSNLGYTEATVSTQNGNRMIIEIPSVKDASDAINMIGSTAKLQFMDADGNVVLEGSDVKDAEAVYGQTGESKASSHYVSLTLNNDAVQKFADATEAAAARAGETDESGRAKNYISIVLDGKVQSSPSVREKIESDTCVITGDFEADEAKNLAAVIKAGSLPFNLKNIQQSVVSATLGEGILADSLKAGLIGLILILLFMLIIYRVPGLVADIALIAYVAIMGLIMAIFKVNLSLSGIAGIILTIGMAVDANVIIFERIKEELRNGKTVRASVDSGFHRAITAVIDSNVTTMIAAVVLYIFGMNTIQGFALTLGIGIIASMITAVLVTRILLKSLVGLGVSNPAAFGVKAKKEDK